MRDSSKKLPSPPYNPGLRDVVERKRCSSSSTDTDIAKRGFAGWNERGYLPHRDSPGLTQFVTFRLNDSLPLEKRGEWEALLAIEDNRERRKKLETYLDKGLGACDLKNPQIAEAVERTFRFFQGMRYELLAWVVMPNHAHVLFKVGSTAMAQVVKGWKSVSARDANKILSRTGQFWHEDYWDTYMRGAEQELKARRYIENNPVKAGLVSDPREWPWSSARFRDELGRLCLE